MTSNFVLGGAAASMGFDQLLARAASLVRDLYGRLLHLVSAQRAAALQGELALALWQLDDRQLRDIGLSREQLAIARVRGSAALAGPVR
ncbi:MAG TPA: DUF1127 domain-containing protein [Paracoccaceae bacterium]|nr:DUF1127 domain-containing protein [Paracoccaceae bacterium]